MLKAKKLNLMNF